MKYIPFIRPNVSNVKIARFARRLMRELTEKDRIGHRVYVARAHERVRLIHIFRDGSTRYRKLFRNVGRSVYLQPKLTLPFRLATRRNVLSDEYLALVFFSLRSRRGLSFAKKTRNGVVLHESHPVSHSGIVISGEFRPHISIGHPRSFSENRMK